MEEKEKILDLLSPPTSAVKYDEIEDVINKNSQGCHKKPRKKLISCSVFYFPPPTPASDPASQTPPQLCPWEHEACLTDVEDEVNVAPRQRRSQKNYQIEQRIDFYSLGHQEEGKPGPKVIVGLEPPGEVSEDIDDIINHCSPPPSHPPLHTGHQVEPPSLHYLLPPLIYNVDPRDNE